MNIALIFLVGLVVGVAITPCGRAWLTDAWAKVAGMFGKKAA